MNKLKPCPFCGGKAAIREDVEYYNLIVQITCDTCFTATRKKIVDNDKEKATNEIIKTWNRRTSNEQR